MPRLTRSSFACLALAMVTLSACKATPDPRKSTKGEVCQTTNDCADGLDCVPRASEPGGLCVNGQFKVSPTAKECAVIACAQPVDCCPTTPQGIDCTTLNNECQQFGAKSSYCTEYNTYCKCDGSKYSCDNGACSSICTQDADCPGGGTGAPGSYTCNGGKCVQCQSDSNCQNGLVCNDVGLCVPPCQSDTDCSAFNRCSNGHCSSTGGCATDRECIAATKNVTATCSNGTCVVPCNSDLECGNPEEYKFYSCIKNQCIYVGCQTDKECQLYLGASGTGTGTGPASKHQQIVCRDKTSH